MPQISQQELLKSITTFLERTNIPYMITGAWSVIYYARPRASHDIDFIVELERKDIPRVLAAFEKLSYEYLIQKDSIKDAIVKKGVFNIIHLPTTLKLDFWLLTDDSFDKTRFARRKKVKLLGKLMSVATAEDTILKKLAWYKISKLEKHLVDAAFVYQVQKKKLDKGYIKKWVKELKLQSWFNEMSKIDLEEYM